MSNKGAWAKDSTLLATCLLRSGQCPERNKQVAVEGLSHCFPIRQECGLDECRNFRE